MDRGDCASKGRKRKKERESTMALCLRTTCNVTLFSLSRHATFRFSRVRAQLFRGFSEILFANGEQKGRRSVKSNSANVRRLSSAENIPVPRCGRISYISATCSLHDFFRRVTSKNSPCATPYLTLSNFYSCSTKVSVT